jgi:hypothetical protein
MAKLYNLARVATGTTGTGTITLGPAVSGFLTFAQAGVADGDTVTYAISDGTNSEIGRGVYTASGTTLTRTVLKSTNSNSAISLSGSAQVFITAAAEDIPNLDAWTTSFTPTVTAGSGTFTSVSATMAYKQIGKTFCWRALVTITTNGTAAGAVQITLPPGVTPMANANAGSGRASSISGNMLVCQVFGGGTPVIVITLYNNGYPGATGETLAISGLFEVA